MNTIQFYNLLNENSGHLEGLNIDQNLILDFSDLIYDFSHFTSIRIENCTFLGREIIRNLDFKNFSIEFINCAFKNTARQIWENINAAIVSLVDCSFENLYISNSEIEDTYIDDCSFYKKLTLFNISGDQFSIKSIDVRRKINNVVVNSSNLKSILINNAITISLLQISNIQNAYILGNYNKIVVEAKSFKNIEIGNNYSKEKGNSIINLFQISDVSFEGVLTLSDLHIIKLNLDNLNVQNGSIRFNEIALVESSFFDCNVSSFYWNQVKFIQNPEIIRCDLSGLKLTNVTWTEGKKLYDSFLDEHIPWLYLIRKNHLKSEISKDEIMEMQYQRDTYRQLKAASIANHNQIEALDFYRNEMRLYWKEIRVNGGVKLQDRILIFLNRFVSDFGQNWILPVFWLIIFHFIFIMCLYQWQFSLSLIDFENGLGQFFKLLNPVHKTPDYINTGLGYLTEFFMRVLSGFFIFHFVKATRKFGNK